MGRMPRPLVNSLAVRGEAHGSNFSFFVPFKVKATGPNHVREPVGHVGWIDIVNGIPIGKMDVGLPCFVT